MPAWQAAWGTHNSPSMLAAGIKTKVSTMIPIGNKVITSVPRVIQSLQMMRHQKYLQSSYNILSEENSSTDDGNLFIKQVASCHIIISLSKGSPTTLTIQVLNVLVILGHYSHNSYFLIKTGEIFLDETNIAYTKLSNLLRLIYCKIF